MKSYTHASLWCVPIAVLCVSGLALQSASPGVEPVRSSSAPARRASIHTEIPEIPLDALVEAASNVIYGKVLGSQAVFPPTGIPYTAYELEVHAAFKQPVGARTTIGVGGASKPDHTVTLVDAPHFEVGEEIVVLTWTGSTTLPPGILGLGLGTYRVSTAADGSLIARRDRPGTALPLGELFVDVASAVERSQAAAQEEK